MCVMPTVSSGSPFHGMLTCSECVCVCVWQVPALAAGGGGGGLVGHVDGVR